MKDENLTTLVRKAKMKDEIAFQKLYQRYHKLVHYIAYQITKNDADADDILQETFLQVQKSIEDLNDPNQFKSWVGRIAYSKSMKQFQKHRDQTITESQLQFLGSKVEQRKDFLPDATMRHDNDMLVLHRCIGNLKIAYREVLILYYFAQLNIKEIASTLAIPEGTVKSRLLYGKKYLKEEIEKYERHSGEHITFHGKALEVVLTSVGASFTTAGISSSFLHFKHITIPTSTILMGLKVSLVALASVGVVSGGYGIYQNMIKDSSSNDLIQQEKDVEQKQFPIVVYQGKEITNARMAYQTLIEWAHCNVEMKSKSSQDIIEIKPVFETLEHFGGVYQQLLHQSDWADEFKNIAI